MRKQRVLESFLMRSESPIFEVSDSPFVLDKDLWRTALTQYKIGGHPVFDLTRSKDQARLDEVLRLADQPQQQPRSQEREIETRANG